MNTKGPILLARYLALACLGLIIYASLHPFSGWRISGISPLAFLEGGWPRYWTVFDLVVNALAYLPLGFLFTLALARVPGRFSAAVLATLAAAAVSLGMECLQVYLPSRVPSNLDLVCNSLGGLIGAVLAYRAGPRFFPHLIEWQHRLLAPLPHAELGLTLLGLWLLIPLSPEILLFGAGDVREVFDLAGAMPFSPGSSAPMETAVIACNTVAVGLLVRWLAANTRLAYSLAPIFLALGLAVRSLAAAVLVSPEQAFSWWTPPVQNGLLAGGLFLLPALFLPAGLRIVLAALALMCGTVLVNITPPNPYSIAALASWRQGHFLNFNGLTRLISILWPFLVLPFLMFSNRRTTENQATVLPD
ncbi:MAG: VanZ like protein [Proteobacteria bacterium]|nr:VanZ like protein [Pseudomonadota bacterium]